MTVLWRRVLPAILLVVITGCTSSTQVAAPLEDQLDLSAPDATVDTMIELWTSRDFIPMLLTIDPETRNAMFEEAKNFDLNAIRSEPGLRSTNWDTPGEHANPMAFMANAFVEATELGVAHIDLIDAQRVGSTVVDRESADVRVELTDGTEVTVQLVEDAPDHWLVASIVPDGASNDDRSFIARENVCASRVTTYPDSPCPASEFRENMEIDPAVQAKIDALVDDAGDDINKQIDAAQAIQNLINQQGVGVTDADLCRIMQGVQTNRLLLPLHPRLLTRGAELHEDTCPGNIDWLTVETAREEYDFANRHPTYQSLDLSSPQAAIETYISLFNSGAYHQLLLVLDASAQINLSTRIELDAAPELEAKLGPLATGERGFYAWLILFPEMMQSPEGRELLHPRDLASAKVTGAATTQTWPGDDGPIEGTIVNVTVGDDQPLVFLTTQSLEGRWRVRQIAPTAEELDPTTSAVVK